MRPDSHSAMSTSVSLAQQAPAVQAPNQAPNPPSAGMGLATHPQASASSGARAGFRYPGATSRVVMAGLDRIERRASDAASRSRDCAKRGVESARRIGGTVYGEAERRLVPRRLLELRSLQQDWRKRAALQVASAFMVSLSLGLIALNAVVMVDAPNANAATSAQGAHARADAVQSLHAPPAPPAQGYVAQAMGRHSATLPRPIESALPIPAMETVASTRPTAVELRRQYEEDRARFRAQNSQPEAELAAHAQRADEAARILAAHTLPTRNAVPLPPPEPSSTVVMGDPADVSVQAYDPANVGAAATMPPQFP